MKYITLFWEVLLFIPTLIFLFFVNPNSIYLKIEILKNISILLEKILPFFSIEQIYVWLLLFWALIIWEIIGASIKLFFFKARPKPMKYNNWKEKILAGSFPSLHSERTFLLFLFSLYFTNYYVVFWFFLFWVLIAYSRVYLKKHYWIDILWWVILASLVFCWLILILTLK